MTISLKHLTQIVAAFIVSVSAGFIVRDVAPSSCSLNALEDVLDGGRLRLSTDCVLMINPAAVVTGEVIIEGGILHSGGVDRVFIVEDNAQLTLINTAVLSGAAQINPAYGGGIYNQGILNVIRSRISANSAEQGGAIYNTGQLTIIDSDISRNRATVGGAIYNRGWMLIQTSSISENSAFAEGDYGGYGAGIVNKSYAGVINSRISDNRGNGEGIGIDTSGALVVRNSIIMNNRCTVSDCRGTGILRFEGTVDARNNYWGSPDGPSEEGAGNGDGVIGLAENSYTPFLEDVPNWAD